MSLFGFYIPLFIITFLLGLIPSLITFLYKRGTERWQYNKFKLMLINEYVSNDYITKGSGASIIDIYSKNCSKVAYLVANELKYLRYSNQLSFIRLAEFTNMYLKEVSEILSAKRFPQLDETTVDISSLMAVEILMPELIELYIERRVQYVKMDRDSFLSYEELSNFKQKYKELIN